MVGDGLIKGEKALIAAGRLAQFRCCYGQRAWREGGGVALDSATAELLEVREGDTVWSVAR